MLNQNLESLTLSRRRPISYRNQSIDLLCKSMNWFLYDIGRHCKRVKLPLTALGCYDTNFRLLNYLNNKLISHELKILNYDGLWENKKFSDENKRFDWIKLIHGYRLVNIG